MEQQTFSKLASGKIAMIAALGFAVVSLAGCGVRGSLEAPRKDVATDSTEKSGPDKGEKRKPFVLDGLIR